MATAQESECAEFNPSEHKIFLSHSGVQKPFAEQLWVDLKRLQHSPFFDKYSLPKGEKFASIIIEAARQCKLAVVILSEDYLVSKWPMIELCAFMEQSTKKNASIKILPLFYKLSIEDCKKNNNSADWYQKWKELAAKDRHGFNVDKCKDALRNLLSWNGLEFDQSKGSEVDYRTSIIGSICKLVRPDYWDEEGIQGRDRLCKIVAEKFVEAGQLYTSSGVLALGLYGLGGIGKTTICRGMCNYFYGDFSGKVWHMQLPSNPTSEAEVINQLLLVLEELTEADAQLLKKIKTISEAGMHLKKRMKGRVVFLSIDNVSEVAHSMDAARPVLKAGFGKGSKVLVTARSGDVLERLLGPQSSIMATPAILEKDAVGILLNHAAPGCTLRDLSDGEQFVIDAVVKHYHSHPLALNTFGDVLSRHGRGESVWREKLEKLQQNLMKDEDPVSCMIQTCYDDLSAELKLVFLDVAVLLPIALHKQISIKDASDWLNSVHRSSGTNDLVFDGMVQLQTLRKSTLLDWAKDGILQIHDLFAEHAIKEVRKSEESRCLVCFEHPDYESLPELSTKAWGKLERITLIDLQPESLAKIRWERCSAVKALFIESCLDFKELRLMGLLSLHSLDIRFCPSLVKLEGLSRLNKLRQLRVHSCHRLFAEEELGKSLKWTHSMRKLLASSPQQYIESLTTLESLDLNSTGLEGPLNLSRCRGLQELRLAYFPKLGNLTELQILQVRSEAGQSSKIKELLELSALPGLREFDLEGEELLVSLPSLHMLAQLRSLRVAKCKSLKRLPDLTRLTHLQELSVQSCGKVKQLPGVENLARLQKLELIKMRLSKFPEFGSLTELNSLLLRNCEMREINTAKPLEFLMASLVKLVNLKELFIESCTGTREFLDLSEISRVENLSFLGFANLKRVVGVSNTLLHLSLHWCEGLEAIPDLRNLPKLTRLDVKGCKKLALPMDLQKLSTLDEVHFKDCVATVDDWMDYTRVDALFLDALEALQTKIWEAQEAAEKLAIRDVMAAAAGERIIGKIADGIVEAYPKGLRLDEDTVADTLMCLSWRQGQPDVEMADRIARCIGVKALTAGITTYIDIPVREVPYSRNALVGVLAAVAATGKYWEAFLLHNTPSALLYSWDSRGEPSLCPCSLDFMAHNREIAQQLSHHQPMSACLLLLQHIQRFGSKLVTPEKSRYIAALAEVADQYNRDDPMSEDALRTNAMHRFEIERAFGSRKAGIFGKLADFVGEHRLEKEFAFQVLQNLVAKGCRF